METTHACICSCYHTSYHPFENVHTYPLGIVKKKSKWDAFVVGKMFRGARVFTPLSSLYCSDQCEPGTFSVGAAVRCTPCPAGSFCGDIFSDSIACAKGYYSLERQTECTLCPAGYQCSNPSTSKFGFPPSMLFRLLSFFFHFPSFMLSKSL